MKKLNNNQLVMLKTALQVAIENGECKMAYAPHWGRDILRQQIEELQDMETNFLLYFTDYKPNDN